MANQRQLNETSQFIVKCDKTGCKTKNNKIKNANYYHEFHETKSSNTKILQRFGQMKEQSAAGISMNRDTNSNEYHLKREFRIFYFQQMT